MTIRLENLKQAEEFWASHDMLSFDENDVPIVEVN